MKEEWFYAENDEQQGPVAEGELRNLWTMGTITEDTLVWRDGMTDWIPYREAMEKGMSLTPPAPANPAPPASPGPPAATRPGASPGMLTGARAVATAPPTPGEATASLVLGILGLACFGLLTGIPAVICGHIAIKKIDASNGTLGGRGLAKAGLITGYIGIVLTVLGILFYAVLFLASVSQATVQ